MRQDMVDAQRSPGRAGPGKARRVKRSDADHPANQPADGTQSASPDPRFRGEDGAGSDDGTGPDRPNHDRPTTGQSPERQAGNEGEEGAAAPKKRRRRRKPAGGAAAAPDAGTGE
jgi:poly(A) polymerase